MAGTDEAWRGQSLHGIPKPKDGVMSPEWIESNAESRWFTTKQYVAILMNPGHYNEIEVTPKIIRPGSMHKGATKHDDPEWVLLEKKIESIPPNGVMELTRFGSTGFELEKRMYCLLSNPELALFHFRTLAKEDKPLVMAGNSIASSSKMAGELERGIKKVEARKRG